jgi:threonine/homoserine/homoserine lactone efflux protein
VFRTGVIFNLLNPKAWTVVISATAAYASLTESTAVLATVLVAIFAVCCAIACITWCAGGHALARVVKTERQWQVVNAVLGLLLALTVIPMWLE